MFVGRIFIFKLMALITWQQLVLAQVRTKIDATKPLRIEYKSSSWNKNPSEVDSSAIILRDALSKKIVRIEVQESGPDTSVFVGQYQLSFQQSATDSTEITPEIFIVPKDVLSSANMVQRINAMVEEGTLFRKPYFLRPVGRGQTITVYDSKDEAYKAYDQFLAAQSSKAGPVPPVLPPSTPDAEQLSRAAAEKLRLETEAKNALDRKAESEAQEAAKRAELIRKQEEMNAQERARKKAQAEEKAKFAMEAYRNGDYQAAAKNFDLSTQLDPSSNQYYYQYGVSLYKIGNFKKSLAILNLSSGDNINPLEKKYYLALNHMKLQDYENSLKEFSEVRGANQKPLSPSSGFFAGVINFQNENYDSAKENFEYVLDNSADPKMDAQAENYIEQIANIKQFQSMKEKRWTLGLNGGLIYDSNILSMSAANAPTDLSGWRLMYGATAEYRILYEKDYDWSATLGLSDMYSTDKSFAASATLQTADPLQTSFYLPYKWRGTFFGKSGQWQVSPGMESITMNADGVGAREVILNSTVIKADNTLVMRDDYFLNYSLEARSDQSLIATTSADEDQTATKVTLYTTNTFFLDKSKTTARIYEGGLTMNMANGANQKYNRIDLAGSYMAPINSTWTWNGRLALYYSDYPSHTSARKDTDIGLSFGARRPLSENISWNLMATYTSNMSNVEASAYNKYTLMSVVNWAAPF